MSKIDVFNLLPVWTFFAPNPGITDYKLLYRIRKKDGHVSKFKNINLNQRKSILNAFWNPDKRSQKALSDLVQELKQFIFNNEISDENQNLIKLTLGYITILNYCTGLEKTNDNDADSVQFMILETYGFFEKKDPVLILNSEFHKI